MALEVLQEVKMFGFNTGDLEEMMRKEREHAELEGRLKDRDKFEADLDEKKRKQNEENEFKEMMSKYKLLHPGQAGVGFGSGAKRNLTSGQVKIGGKRPPTQRQQSMFVGGFS